MKGFSLGFLVLFLTLSGCVSTPVDTSPYSDPAYVQLLEVARSVERATVQLSQIQASSEASGNVVGAYEYDLSKLPPIWREEIELVRPFSGDVGLFVQLLSDVAGLNEPNVLGDTGSRPPIVHLGSGKRPLIDWLADAGFQAGSKARVSPALNTNRVTVEYVR